MMFHRGEDDLVAFTDIRISVARCDQVDGRRRSTRENDFFRKRRMDERADAFACSFIRIRCLRPERMDATMHVRMVATIIVLDRLDDSDRLL